VILALALSSALAQELVLYPEYQRPDIHGAIVKADQRGREREINSPAVARNGYASYIVVAKLPQPGPYRFDVAMNPAGRLRADVYRIAFEGDSNPDALVPIPNTFFGQLPDADNAIPGQTAVAFWLDLHVPANARRETVRVEAVLQALGRRDVYPLEVRILPITVPDNDALEAVYESSRTSGPAAQSLFREHRGLLLEPLDLPSGFNSRWDAFDARYGPLFDGSHPLPYAFLVARPPVTPAEAGLPGILADVRNHFTAKGWTRTRLAVGLSGDASFPWTRDATGQGPDAQRLRRLASLLHPRFVQHNDSSLAFAQQLKELAGVVDHWIVSERELSSAPEAPALLRKRGDRLWTYAEVPAATEPANAILHHVARAWMWGADGLVLRQAPPVPSIRLKIARNALQDLALLRSLESRAGADKLRAELARLTGDTRPSDWWAQAGKPPVADQALAAATADWWPEVRRWIYQLALEPALR
jgi:hypothetical protein